MTHETRPFPIQICNLFKFFGRVVQFIAMVITLGAAFLCSALVLARALQDQVQGHSRFGLGDFALSTPSPTLANGEPEVTCEKIAKAISSKSQVFYPGEHRVLHLYRAPPNDSGGLRLPGV